MAKCNVVYLWKVYDTRILLCKTSKL